MALAKGRDREQRAYRVSCHKCFIAYLKSAQGAAGASR